eukprot:Opistho-2@36288
MKTIHFLFLFITLFNCRTKKTDETSNYKYDSFENKLSAAAISIIDPDVVYTPDYISIKYPNGDVPAKTGVCTDVVIRSYRKLGIDLQKEVHEDMTKNFSLYPNLKKMGDEKNGYQH